MTQAGSHLVWIVSSLGFENENEPVAWGTDLSKGRFYSKLIPNKVMVGAYEVSTLHYHTHTLQYHTTCTLPTLRCFDGH